MLRGPLHFGGSHGAEIGFAALGQQAMARFSPRHDQERTLEALVKTEAAEERGGTSVSSSG